MDADGKNVRRLTNDARLRRRRVLQRRLHEDRLARVAPQAGQGARRLQARCSRRAGAAPKLELYVANADGIEAAPGHLPDAASFAPFFHPSGKRIIFSSNVRRSRRAASSTSGRSNVDGTGLERITYAPGFDGFPMFSPDGKRLAFASNRATAPGRSTTPTSSWRAGSSAPRSPRRTIGGRRPHRRRTSRWLADPAREGRGIGTAGLEAAGALHRGALPRARASSRAATAAATASGSR